MPWTGVHDELFKKVNQELDEYARSMWDVPGYYVYGKADEIAAMKFCYNQLVGHLHDYSSEGLKRLLELEKPLEALCNHWRVEQDVDLESDFDRIFSEWTDVEPDYGFDAPNIN